MKFGSLLLIYYIFLCDITFTFSKSNAQKSVIEDIADIKDLKKLLRTKNNVLICYTESNKKAAPIVKIFREVADIIKGQGTMVLTDCSGTGKKLCKKMKVSPEPHSLKHYKDGEWHKDYDRRETVSSMVNFMRDPAGDLPWEEDVAAQDVAHIPDATALSKFLKKETKPTLVMFYAPWCGFCKTLKPEYNAAATELKGHSVLAAIDVNRPENSVIRTQYNITGFPTMLYYENGKLKQAYDGENTKGGLVSFMQNPQAAPAKPQEVEWSDTDSEVVHLTSDSFQPALQDEPSVLVMFYAPWCGHCKRMKPEYENAALEMRNKNIPGVLAALDATKEPTIATQFGVKGYPTVKYFVHGDFQYDVNFRDASKIIEFMRDPQEPPPPPPPERPWSEEASEVVHLTEETYKPFLKKKKHVLVMFYAPWCGHCKKAKPEYTGAAEKFKDDAKVEFAAIDCTTQKALCSVNGVNSYPTIKYMSYLNKATKDYTGGRLEADFVSFMKNPDAVNLDVTSSEDWGEMPGAQDILQLSDKTFDEALKEGRPMLVMFYAPWCGHCKRLKPEYSLAAKHLVGENIPVHLAVVDCTVNPGLSDRFQIKGYPTLKLFINGKFISDYNGKRSMEDIKHFMKNHIKSDKRREEL